MPSKQRWTESAQNMMQRQELTRDVFGAVPQCLHNSQHEALWSGSFDGAVQFVPPPVMQHNAHRPKVRPLGEFGRVAVDLIEPDGETSVVNDMYETWLSTKRCRPYRAVCIPG